MELNLETPTADRRETPVQPGMPPGKPAGSRLVILILLALLLGAMLYFYQLVAKPPQPLEQAKTDNINHVFSIYGWGKERLSSPNWVAVDEQNRLYVADTGNHRVVAFDRDGNYRFQIGDKNPETEKVTKKKGVLAYPLSVAIGPDGQIFVVSMERSMLQVFDAKGKFKREVPLDRPITVTRNKSTLYITTPGQVWVTDLKGKVAQRFAGHGRGLGQLSYPNGLAINKKGEIIVSDSNNNRIQVFDSRGEPKFYLGEPSKNLKDADVLFGLGMGLALDESENIYVADAFHHAIRIFDNEGETLGEVGEEGYLDGQLSYPSSIAYMGGKRFAVADKANNRIQVLDITPPRDKPAAAAKERAVSLLPVLGAMAGLLVLILVVYLRSRGLRAIKPKTLQ